MKIKSIIKIASVLLLLFLIYVIVVLAYGSMYDWQPAEVTPIELAQDAKIKVIEDSIVSLSIWNLGYGGLGAKSDLFFDNGNQFFAGGRMIRSPKPYVEEYVNGANQFVGSTQSDFFLFQEIDTKSKRSYFINQFDKYRKQRPDYAAAYAPNFINDRIPLPIAEPWRVYGAVHSGLATLSKYQPTENISYQLPGEYDWPTKLFQLDRCVLKQVFPTAKGKNLVVFNVHNSAYDTNGEMKKQQLSYLTQLWKEEYQKGNYVIAGGDWNQVPPNFPFNRFMPGNTSGYTQIPIDADAMPEDWRWVYDPTTPTNRKTRDVYIQKETFETLIDFFLISPNLRVKQVKGINQGFQFSDHQPVWVEVELL